MNSAAPARPARRQWLAIGLATVLMLISEMLLLLPFAAAITEETTVAGGLVGFGLGLVPLVFAVAAFVSGTDRAGLAVLKACGLWLVFVAPIGLYDLLTALVAGFGAGGIIALRLPDTSNRRVRVFGVLLATSYAFVLLRLAPEAGLFGGALAPLVAIGIADDLQRRRSSLAARTEGTEE